LSAPEVGGGVDTEVQKQAQAKEPEGGVEGTREARVRESPVKQRRPNDQRGSDGKEKLVTREVMTQQRR